MKKLFFSFFVLFGVILLSGCGEEKVPPKNEDISASSLSGGILLSQDGGASFSPRVLTEDGKMLSRSDILSFTFDSNNSGKVYIGSVKENIFVSENMAESWSVLPTPVSNIRGIAIDTNNENIIYVAGVSAKRGRIIRSENGGETWQNVYVEPAEGSFVSALYMVKEHPQVLYAGISNGVIVKTTDGGKTWENIHSQGNVPITHIAADPFDDTTLYFLFHENSISITRDRGATFSNLIDLQEEKGVERVSPGQVYSFAVDLNISGKIYVGTGSGIFVATNFGRTWAEVNTIASSREFAIRAIAVDPENSSKIAYGAARAIYVSSDGGAEWHVWDLSADTEVSKLFFDPNNTQLLYAGLREF